MESNIFCVKEILKSDGENKMDILEIPKREGGLQNQHVTTNSRATENDKHDL